MKTKQLIGLSSRILLGAACFSHSEYRGDKEFDEFNPSSLYFQNNTIGKDIIIRKMSTNIAWPGMIYLRQIQIGPTIVSCGLLDAVLYYPLFMQPVIINHSGIKLNHILQISKSIVIDFRYNGYIPSHYLSGSPFELIVQFEISLIT